MTLQEILSKPWTVEEQAMCETVQGIPGPFGPQDMLALNRLVKQTPDDALMLEMGCYRGRSTNAIGHAMAGTNRRVVCVDNWTFFPLKPLDPTETGCSTHFEYFCDFYKNTQWFSSQVIAIRGDNIDQAEFLPPLSFDLVFIDSNHEYDSVKADIDLAYGLLKPGGILCGHDYSPDVPVHVGLCRAVDEDVFQSSMVLESGTMSGSEMWYARLKGPGPLVQA